MSLNVCAHCTTKFAIGLPHCPQCGNADYYEEGSMAKISRSGGATYVGQVAEAIESGEVTAEEVVGAEVDDLTVSPYEAMLRTELQAELGSRGLPTSGNKPELVERLVADDATKAEAPAAPTEEAPADVEEAE